MAGHEGCACVTSCAHRKNVPGSATGICPHWAPEPPRAHHGTDLGAEAG